MYRIEIVFGHRRRDGRPVPKVNIARAEEETLRTLAELFRGGRIQRHLGSYRNQAGDIQLEFCSVASCETPEIDGYLPRLLLLGEGLARALSQETVLLVVLRVDGSQHWVPPAA